MRVHPLPPTPTTRPLSIIDTVCTDFGFCACKLYAAPPAGTPNAFDRVLLAQSLAHVLSVYPHWAGRLRLARPDDSGRLYQRRFGRLWVDYGSHSDPGVQLSFISRNEPLTACLPRDLGSGISDSSMLDEAGLYPDVNEVISLRPTPTDAPAFAIRVTYFSCGGTAIGFRISHTLADAFSYNLFSQDWADVHRAFLAGEAPKSTPLPDRPFNPEALDAHAAGDLDAPAPDPAIEARYNLLPRTRLDMWANPYLHPPGMVKNSQPDAAVDALDAGTGRQRGQPPPWETWDVKAPVRVCSLDLTPEELQRIWRRAQDRSGNDGRNDAEKEDLSNNSAAASRVSAHDALVGHFWRLSMRARDLPPNTPISITPAIGLRARLNPPLPSSFVGSAFILFASETDSTSIVSPSTGLAVAASALRSTIAAATPIALSAVLHHHAFDLDPTRFWPYFCGETHTSMSSWIGAGDYDADFGVGRPVRAEGSLGRVDNMLLFEDLPPVEGEEGRMKKWYERGVRVKLSLRDEVMEKVLADPELRGDF